MENNDELYAKWLSGEISDQDFQSLEGQDAFNDLERVIKTVDQWSMPKYNNADGYKKFKLKHQKLSTPVRKLNWFGVVGIAASFLLVGFIWNIYINNDQQLMIAANGQNEIFRLSDGSEIRLNDGSTAEYNATEWEDHRIVELSGEAFFDVTKGNPFQVNTKNGSIKVLGTEFNVRAWGSNLYVECYEGKVQVVSNNQMMILTKGETINVVNGKMGEKQLVKHSSPLWQKATSRFYNENLKDVFDEVERQYDIKINLKAQHRIFSGNFQHDDLEKALRSICKPLGLTFSISEDQKNVIIE